MVLICGVLAIVVTALLKNVVVAEDYRYCADDPAGLDPETNLPVSTPTVNAQNRTLLDFDPNGACLLVFSHNYPPSSPYAPPANLSCAPFYIDETCPLADAYAPPPAEPRVRSDRTVTPNLHYRTVLRLGPARASSTFLPMPAPGWLPNPLTASLELVDTLIYYATSTQQNFWSLYWLSPGSPSVGSKPLQLAVNISIEATPPAVVGPPTGACNGWHGCSSRLVRRASRWPRIPRYVPQCRPRS